jgi:hypothetical protein
MLTAFVAAVMSFLYRDTKSLDVPSLGDSAHEILCGSFFVDIEPLRAPLLAHLSSWAKETPTGMSPLSSFAYFTAKVFLSWLRHEKLENLKELNGQDFSSRTKAFDADSFTAFIADAGFRNELLTLLVQG